jgi:hypothetical protein
MSAASGVRTRGPVSGAVVTGVRLRHGVGLHVIVMVRAGLWERIDVPGWRRWVRRDGWEDGPVRTQV